MAKGTSPAFQFYASDWLGSTRIALMSPEQEGGYIHLLAHAWADPDCSLPADDRSLATLSRLGARWRRVRAEVMACFEPHPNHPDRIVNAKLYAVRLAQIEAKESGARGGQKSAEKRWGVGKGKRKGTGKGDGKGSVRVVGDDPDENTQGFCKPPTPTPTPEDSDSSLRSESAVRETWATPYCNSFADRFQGEPPIKQICTVVAPVRRRLKSEMGDLGEVETQRRWRAFLADQAPGKYNLHKFTEAHGSYVNGAAPRATAPHAAGQTDSAVDAIMARRAAKGNA